MQDYQIISIRKDGVMPDAFHGEYHIHLLGKAGRMDFSIGSLHFSSQAMLTRYMKRTVGKTPTEYRKQVVSVH